MKIDLCKGAKQLCTNKKIDISVNQKNECKGHCISKVQSAKRIYNIRLHCTDRLHSLIEVFFNRLLLLKVFTANYELAIL